MKKSVSAQPEQTSHLTDKNMKHITVTPDSELTTAVIIWKVIYTATEDGSHPQQDYLCWLHCTNSCVPRAHVSPSLLSHHWSQEIRQERDTVMVHQCHIWETERNNSEEIRSNSSLQVRYQISCGGMCILPAQLLLKELCAFKTFFQNSVKLYFQRMFDRERRVVSSGSFLRRSCVSWSIVQCWEQARVWISLHISEQVSHETQ